MNSHYWIVSRPVQNDSCHNRNHWDRYESALSRTMSKVSREFWCCILFLLKYARNAENSETEDRKLDLVYRRYFNKYSYGQLTLLRKL